MKLHWQILIGIVVGIIIGSFLPGFTPTFGVLGTLFLRALKMIVVPLIFSSLVVGVSNIQKGSALGRIGIKTVLYYMCTSLLALITGLFFVNRFKPGANTTLTFGNIETFEINERPISEVLINIIPENVIKALANGDMLAIIFFALLFGIFINKLSSDKKESLSLFFNAMFDAMMNITMFIIKFAPIGIAAIISVVVAEQSAGWNSILSLLNFAKVVALALLFHFLVTLPIILRVVAKVNPLQHYKAMIDVILTSFSTASSNATLPLTMSSIEEKTGVSNRTASFTLPLGATINMDGTALYELVVAGFVAQLYGIELSITQQFVLVTTALLASIGTAGVPMASLVTMAIVFESIGLPLEAIALILPVDRPLDMMRTTTNVFSDTVGAVVIAKSEKEQLNY